MNRQPAAIPRHRWVHIAPSHRAAVAASCGAAAAHAVSDWLDRDLPLVSRARRPGEVQHLHPLGLCLPLTHPLRRIALTAAHDAVAAVENAAPLSEVKRILPTGARDMATDISETAAALGFEARAFGSCAWQWRSGPGHLHDASDLDLLAAPRDARALAEWLALLSRLDAAAPMRLDGEIECPSGDAVSWRELARAPREVLVKNARGARLVPVAAVRAQFA